MSLQGISRTELLNTVAAALAAAGTLAGERVFVRRVWSLTEENYPAILVSAPLESKRSASKVLQGVPTFHTEVSITVVLRTTGKANGPVAEAADKTLDRLCAEVENVLTTHPAILAMVEGIGDLHTQFTVTNDGAPVLGEAGLLIQYALFQQFVTDDATPLAGIDATRPDADGDPAPFFSLDLPQD